MRTSLAIAIVAFFAFAAIPAFSNEQNPAADTAPPETAVIEANDRLSQSQAAPTSSETTYDRLDLKNGDIIRKIDGQGINDPRQAFEMMNQLKNSGHLEIEREKAGLTDETSP